MARIVLGSYMFRYPLGGMLSWVLQYLLGLKDLGHDVYFVEKYGYDNSCFDPLKKIMSNDCSYGLKTVSGLFGRLGLKEKWCFVEYGEQYHGLSKKTIQEIFRSADIYIDMGTHGNWSEEAVATKLRVLIDGEPGYTQIKMANKLAEATTQPDYDLYFTNGINIGTQLSPAPTVNIKWQHLFHPVSTTLFTPSPSAPNAPFTTIMNWQSHPPIEYNGKTYGQKGIEFQKFLALPKLVSQKMEIAVSGSEVPETLLTENGWDVKDGHKITFSFDSFSQYISSSRGEFSVCKNVFVENNTGWFSDKSGAYLAKGKPVILQDTGFSSHLPVGQGLFAVNTLDEARHAIQEVERDYEFHSRKAREIAKEYLETKIVMKKFLTDAGI